MQTHLSCIVQSSRAPPSTANPGTHAHNCALLTRKRPPIHRHLLSGTLVSTRVVVQIFLMITVGGGKHQLSSFTGSIEALTFPHPTIHQPAGSPSRSCPPSTIAAVPSPSRSLPQSPVRASDRRCQTDTACPCPYPADSSSSDRASCRRIPTGCCMKDGPGRRPPVAPRHLNQSFSSSA